MTTINSTIAEKIDRYQRAINQQLSELDLPSLPEELYAPIKYVLQARGKRIRPALLWLVGENLRGKSFDLMNAALAVELLHTFTLVHDDIMDQDTRRRGAPTVHVKWDQNTAILSGDGLMSLAFYTLMKTANTDRIAEMGRHFSMAMLEICEGQAMDISFEKRSQITTDQYLQMVTKKTGKLIGLSCRLGAIIARANPKIISALDQFGIELGQAFQIQDDLLEITADEKKMGKSLGSDLASGKKTYPLVVATAKMSAVETQKFMSFISKNTYNRAVVRQALQDNGSIDQCRKKIADLLETALQRLTICPQHLQRDLENFVALISNRKS